MDSKKQVDLIVRLSY